MLFTHSTNSFAKDPAVVHFHGKYYLYYTVRYDDKSIGIGVCESDDMETWREFPDIPRTQECEKNGTGAPAAIVLNGIVHLFYQTYGNFPADKLCHATSKDGIHFEKDPTNPIFSPSTAWSSGRAIDADVVPFGDELLLYFATRDRSSKIQKVGGIRAKLDSDFSRDAWSMILDQSMLIPEYTWEGECIEAPATLVHNGKVYMFYGGAWNCSPQQIGCAVSDDGVFFKRLFTDKPFMANGKPGEWNSSESGHPYAFVDDDGRTYLFYQGSSDMGKTWYLSRTEIGFDADGIPYRIDG